MLFRLWVLKHRLISTPLCKLSIKTCSECRFNQDNPPIWED